MDLGTALWQELAGDFPNNEEIVRIAVRLLFAMMVGGAIGFERGQVGKAAGLRTHMLVALGTALATLVPILSEMPGESVSRVIQGALAGIGFIGGGAILKMSERHEIVGVTTAASIWLAACGGVAVGAGHFGLAIGGTILALIILALLGRLEHPMIDKEK